MGPFYSELAAAARGFLHNLSGETGIVLSDEVIAEIEAIHTAQPNPAP